MIRILENQMAKKLETNIGTRFYMGIIGILYFRTLEDCQEHQPICININVGNYAGFPKPKPLHQAVVSYPKP